jgi:predicted transcriptional regulator of viral defense system
VKRGTYLILPLEAGPKAPTAIEDPWVLARELFSPSYIGGWSAAEHWDLTEQIFRSTFVVTARRPRQRSQRWAAADYQVVHVPARRMRGTTLVWRGREQVAVSGPDRTIADALAAPRWVGGVHHLAQIMEAYRASPVFNPLKLVDETAQLAKGAALKRLGYLAETLWPDLPDVARVARARLPKGVIKLDPSVNTRGRLNKRWGLWINVAIRRGGASQ